MDKLRFCPEHVAMVHSSIDVQISFVGDCCFCEKPAEYYILVEDVRREIEIPEERLDVLNE